MLREDLDGEMILENGDVRMILDGLNQTILNLGAGVVLMMKDAEFGVSAFTMQIVIAVGIFIEMDAPADQFLDLRRRIANHLFNSGAVTQVVARNHGVLNVFVKVIHLEIGHRSNATLCEERVRLFQSGLTDQCY